MSFATPEEMVRLSWRVTIERLRPKVIRNRFQNLEEDGDYVTYAWIRGAPGPQEFIEITWGPQHARRCGDPECCP